MGKDKRIPEARARIDDDMMLIRGIEVTPDWVHFEVECGDPLTRVISGETRSAEQVWLTDFAERHGSYFKRVFEIPFGWPQLYRTIAYLREQGYEHFRLDGEFAYGPLEELTGAKDVDDWLKQNVWLLNYTR